VGKGFTFDADEMNEAQKVASMQRKAYDIEQGLVEEKDYDDDADDEEDDGAGAKVNKKAAAAAQAALPPPPTAAELEAMPPLQRAMALAASLAHLAAGSGANPAGAPGAIAVDGPTIPLTVDAQAAMARARLIALQMSAMSSSSATTQASKVKNYFSDELEINDYPHQARRKVTQRSSIEEILDRTGVTVVSRGVHFAAGKIPGAGERALHLLIEGTDAMSVRQAKLDITRMLDEETIRIGAGAVGGSSGRYSVI
jgi:ATP-dependent RNA helicase DDX46/PRP5